jgi:transposase
MSRRKASVPNRQYTQEFKLEAVRLSESVGGTEAARRLGIPESSVGNWVKLARAGKLAGVDAAVAVKRPQSELEAENSRLKRELANTKLDLEIVKKAAAYFARESR